MLPNASDVPAGTVKVMLASGGTTATGASSTSVPPKPSGSGTKMPLS
jgi:hypothetical protein